MKKRSKVSGEAESRHLADIALADNFDELLATARATELKYRHAQATGAPVSEQYPLARQLDAELTAAMHAAYAAQRAEIGPRGYDDRIYRRKAMARPAVHRWTDEAERLLTLRESYLLTGFPARPEVEALGAQVARIPAALALAAVPGPAFPGRGAPR